MGPSRERWATGFAVQAKSDWQVYRMLTADENIPQSHGLHYLQMACEKIAKSYRLRDPQADVDGLLTRHVGFKKFMRAYWLSPAMRAAYQGKDGARRSKAAECEILAAEIEKLAPAVGKAQSPANAEYPWADNERVIVPSQYSFPGLALLRSAGGRAFLKLLDKVISEPA